MKASIHPTERAAERKRWHRLRALERRLDLPMAVLGAIWLALLVLELTRGLPRALEITSLAIWGVFVVEFLVRLTVSPAKLRYLGRNWLTVIALIVPALRVLRFARILRVLRAGRGIRLVRLVASLNRGMRALGRTMARRGVGYVAILTLMVLFGGAAGMLAFERGALASYGDALWWTAMLLTTMGSGFWPESAEGRILALLLSIYALGVLGYVTAALASFFVGREVEHKERSRAPRASNDDLVAELRALRAELHLHRGLPGEET